MFAAGIANNIKRRKNMYYVGICVGERKCSTVFKNGRGNILDDLFFGVDENRIQVLLSTYNQRKQMLPSSVIVLRQHSYSKTA